MDASRIEHLAALARIRSGEVSYDDARIFCRGCAQQQACRLGLRLRRDEDSGGVTGTVEFPEWTEGGGGAVHGGLVMAVLDELLSAVHTSRGELGITVEFETRFDRPVPISRSLSVAAWPDGEQDGFLVTRGTISADRPLVRATG